MHTYKPITTEWFSEMPFIQDPIDPTTYVLNNGTHSFCLTKVEGHGYRMDVRTFDEHDGRWQTIFHGYLRSIMHFRVALDIADQYFGDLHPVESFFAQQLEKKRINAILDGLPTAPQPVEYNTLLRRVSTCSSISDLVGKTFYRVYTNFPTNDELHFVMDDGSEYIFRHEQECCESVLIDDICGDLSDLEGSVILKAEQVSNHDAPPKDEGEESYTWTFYKFATQKGYVDVRWYGCSNGYYSEDVDLVFVPSQESMMHQVFRAETTLLYDDLNQCADYITDLSAFTQSKLKTHIEPNSRTQACAYGPVFLIERNEDSFIIAQELHLWKYNTID